MNVAGFPKRITVRASCPVPDCTASLLVSGAVAARLGAAGEPPGPGRALLVSLTLELDGESWRYAAGHLAQQHGIEVAP